MIILRIGQKLNRLAQCQFPISHENQVCFVMII